MSLIIHHSSGEKVLYDFLFCLLHLSTRAFSYEFLVSENVLYEYIMLGRK